jgi:hypothetical protein
MSVQAGSGEARTLAVGLGEAWRPSRSTSLKFKDGFYGRCRRSVSPHPDRGDERAAMERERRVLVRITVTRSDSKPEEIDSGS